MSYARFSEECLTDKPFMQMLFGWIEKEYSARIFKINKSDFEIISNELPNKELSIMITQVVPNVLIITIT